ncbi:unnamed protein product, partial [Leptidea sinapis]
MSDKNSCLQPLYWNADGVHKKQQELADLAGTGQGVAILVRSDIPHSTLPIPTTTNLEAVGILIQLPKTNIAVISAYMSPNKLLLTSDLNAMLSCGTQVLVMGDLNTKHPYWSPGTLNSRDNTLYHHILDSEFVIFSPQDPTLVHYHTNIIPSTPDLLLSKNFNHIDNICTTPTLSSNHFPFFAKFNKIITRRPITKYNFSKADWTKYRQILNSNINLSSSIYKTTTEIDLAISDFQNTILAATIVVKPWSMPALPRRVKRLIQQKNRLRRYAAAENDIAVHHLLKLKVRKLQFDINYDLKTIHDNAWSKKLGKVANPNSDLWRVIKSLKSNNFPPIPTLKRCDGTLATSKQDQCNTLADSFLSNMLLTHNWFSEEQATVDCS